jgi:hypothetical protein
MPLYIRIVWKFYSLFIPLPHGKKSLAVTNLCTLILLHLYVSLTALIDPKEIDTKIKQCMCIIIKNTMDLISKLNMI